MWIYSYLRPLQDKETLSTPFSEGGGRGERQASDGLISKAVGFFPLEIYSRLKFKLDFLPVQALYANSIHLIFCGCELA